MKRILLGLILFWPISVFGQTFVNPDTTQQSGDIYIQNTDVYYYPMAPDTSDSRESLCNMAEKLLNPNGVASGYYHPVAHDTVLQNWAPCGVPLGPNAIWQRFFTAKRHGGIPSDIIAGSNVTNDTAVTHGYGPVIISKNEDVDFRASGTIKLENGFHAMPGCFFHAYQEPRWGPTVFSDNFNGTTLDRSKWHVDNGYGDNYNVGFQCSSDSDVRIDTDYQATDGYALDIMLLEDTNKFSNVVLGFGAMDSCHEDYESKSIQFLFSTATIRSCPFPWVSRDQPSLTPAYQDAPYGKYEVREKIPHVMHHTNNWDYDQFEYDMNETWNGNMGQLHPGAGSGLWHGPYKGIFGPKSGTDTTRVFRCSQANWCSSNIPYAILVAGNFDFDVQFNLTPTDTFLTVSGTTYEMGGFPFSYADSTDSITFYYRRQTTNSADSVTWTVSANGAGSYRIFSAPYHVVHGVPLIFSKSYQPTSITLIYDTIPINDSVTLHCHWVDSLNDPTNYGKIYLDDTLPAGALHSNTQRYTYTVLEGYGPVPSYGFNGMDTTPGSYQYHTFTMELLPNETRILMDSNVVWRGPDRLDPPSDSDIRGYWIPRSPVGIHPAEVDIDASPPDTMGTNDSIAWIIGTDTGWKSITYAERKYFEQHPHNPGMWDVTIGGKTYHAAHHLVDYVKVWDTPADVKIPKYPH